MSCKGIKRCLIGDRGFQLTEHDVERGCSWGQQGIPSKIMASKSQSMMTPQVSLSTFFCCALTRSYRLSRKHVDAIGVAACILLGFCLIQLLCTLGCVLWAVYSGLCTHLMWLLYFLRRVLFDVAFVLPLCCCLLFSVALCWICLVVLSRNLLLCTMDSFLLGVAVFLLHCIPFDVIVVHSRLHLHFVWLLSFLS